MPTIDLGTPPPAPAAGLTSLPRRLTLTLPELQLVATYAGGAPLPFELVPPPAESGLGSRLGATPATLDAAAYERALAALHDPEASLARRGLLVDTAVDDGLLGAVGLLATPNVALDLDISAGGARVRAWHRQRDGAVATLATADGIVFELAWFASERWGDELARVAAIPAEMVGRASAVPEVDLPYELLDAAGEASRTGRTDLLPVLVADHSSQVRDSDGRPLRDLDVLTLLGGLTTECRGRLRALVADVSVESTTLVGVVSWVLLADGWRALRPHRADGVDRVTVAPVSPEALAVELAPVLAEVVR
ncbi:ESX secretion-associated protein EspG [Nocardioides mangrovi]|uniref:ESX secretion-associated protein EspG n=1 Tax=Nocardioides mangrovi TaxID=2874580 RepID=A0ABS7UDT6_9ACTN|nr:ESX secretion-associated protein EspG [Nocardioides mangrovi]MBZ5739019.1 ESX secretion-associated protein EspG [Nocardioides mangrovi]